jgi:outer membrane protein assembly factor BamB
MVGQTLKSVLKPSVYGEGERRMRSEAIVCFVLVMLFFVSVFPASIFIVAAESHSSSGTSAARSTADPVDWWPMFHHDVNHTGYSTSAPTTNRTAWSYATGSCVLSSPAVVNGMVYVGSNDGSVYCLNGSSGAFVWSYLTGGAVSSSPAVANGMVYVGSDDDNVYALNAATGASVWNYTTGGHVDSSPAVADGAVYVGSADHNFYCLNESNGAFVWSYSTGGTVSSSPAVANGMVYVGSNDNNVYALNAATGASVWNYTTGAWVGFSPAVADGAVYVGSSDNNLYCLNASTGMLVWNYTAGLAWSSPAVAGGDVYVGLEDGICCLNGLSGKLVWSYMTEGEVDSSPAVAGGMVCAGSDDGNVYCLNESSGAIVWSYLWGGALFSSPALAEGMLYVGSEDGNVYCFGTSQTYVYNVVVCAHSYSDNADVSVPIMMDGLPTGNETPYELTGLTGTHTFTVPAADASNDAFLDWGNGERTRTITVSSGGVYTAYYVGQGETILSVPFRYQEKDYYCGPACLQMVFSYYGRSILQSEIACAARSIGFPVYGTACDDLRRAAQFSNASTSMGDQLPQNITGYTSQPLGCSAFETSGMNLTVLQSYLEQGKPLILCMWFSSSHAYGHFRVAIGYNQTHFFLQDPWNRPLWGGKSGGPVTAFTISQFTDLWSYDNNWALYVSPWNVTFSAPIGVSPGKPFQVQSTITYPQPPSGTVPTYPASACNASIMLPSGLSLAPGENQAKTLGTGFMQAGNSQNVTWTLIANSSVTGAVSIRAEGMTSGSVTAFENYQAYDYSDQIGAVANFAINITTSPYHEFAVTEVSFYKTIVGRGYAENLTVTAANLGDYAETFNVTLYANTAPLGNITVTGLLNATSTLIIFVWNTTGFAYGNYTLSAYIWPVAGETNIANNNFTGGMVYVGIPGDLNGDGMVNILDAILFANHFYETPSMPGWNHGGANADINGDNVVDILDAIILARHFNQHYP